MSRVTTPHLSDGGKVTPAGGLRGVVPPHFETEVE